MVRHEVGPGAVVTILVPRGLGADERAHPVMAWADLREYSEFTRDFVMAAEAAMKAGKSVDEAVNGLKLPDKYRDYNMTNAKADVQKVFDELKR